jgi:hypothetical protein
MSCKNIEKVPAGSTEAPKIELTNGLVGKIVLKAQFCPDKCFGY